MEKSKLIYAIKKKTTYETDRYEMRYHISDEGEIRKAVWPTNCEVGPEAYDLGHVDNVVLASDIYSLLREHPANREKKLSKEYVKFKP